MEDINIHMRKGVWMFQQHEDILIFSFDCILLRMSGPSFGWGPIPSAINGCTGDDTKGETQYLCPFVDFLFDWAQRDLVSWYFMVLWGTSPLRGSGYTIEMIPTWTNCATRERDHPTGQVNSSRSPTTQNGSTRFIYVPTIILFIVHSLSSLCSSSWINSRLYTVLRLHVENFSPDPIRCRPKYK